MPDNRRLKRVAVALAALGAGGLAVPALAAADEPPVAAFVMGPNPATAGEPVIIEDRSTDPDGQITVREWDVTGDGTFDRPVRQRIIRTYPRPRCIVIRLRVTDNAGNVAQKNQMLTVRNAGALTPVCPPPPPDPPPIIRTPPPPPMNLAPIASFTVSPPAPQIGQAVALSSTATDPDGAIAGQEWDLDGDGVFGDASGPSASTTFATAGAHTVSLRVADDRGVVVIGSAAVTVIDPSSQPPPDDRSGVEGQREEAPRPQLDAAVRLRTRVGRRRTRVELLTVRAPAGSTVTLRCSASRCPFSRSVSRIGTRERTVRFKRPEGRLLYAGTLLQVFVTRPGAIGAYVSFRMRLNRVAPRRAERCLRPGGMRPYRCPSR
jgi:PKD repeat protein